MSRIPFTFGPSAAALCSAAITMVGLPTVNVGFWYGVDLRPRVTISRMCTPSCISLASTVSYIIFIKSPGVTSTSMSMALAPWNSRLTCSAAYSNTPPCSRTPSQTPSPSTKPLSKTDTLASTRGISENAPVTPSRMPMRTDALRGSGAYACVPDAGPPSTSTDGVEVFPIVEVFPFPVVVAPSLLRSSTACGFSA